MKAATAAVVLILIGLVAAWWRSHANAPRPEIIALTVPAENTSAGDLTSLPAGLIVVPPQAHATQTVSSLLPLRAAATAAPVVTHEPEKLATIAPARPAHPEQAAAKTSADASIPAYKRAAMAQPVNNPVTEDNTEVE